jgi:hypothetical protein
MIKPISATTDFDYLVTFLPDGWQSKAKELGALTRCRKIPNAETLLRYFFFIWQKGVRCGDGGSPRPGGIANIRCAIMDRLRGAGDWLRWMSVN